MLLDQVIEANLDELFRGMEILETHLFRVTRDADIAIEEDEADDLLLAIEEEIRRRRFGEAVRLEVERSMPELTRQILIKGTGVRDEDAFEVAGMLDLTALWQLVSLDRPDLKAPVHSPVIPQRLLPPDEDEPTDVFAQMRTGDIFVHHPYESFTASTERFIDQAADDPEVLTIKQTLYRTSGQSPIVGALIRAAEAGKQVVVLVEIKAPLRRGEQHRLGPPPRAGRRPRRVRPGRPQDALQGGAGGPAGGQRRSAATSTSAPATTTARPRACTRTSGC